tara:strand:- start:36 stop:218 length:183 start_codon:yes stop_codon:yes gene_type:complete
MRTPDKIDRASIEQWLGTDRQLDEALEILVDMFNGDYSVEMFRNDVNSYYEPDDRGDMNR